MSVGLGPYKIVEWRAGQEIELEAYEGYNPNPKTVFSKALSIKRVGNAYGARDTSNSTRAYRGL